MRDVVAEVQHALARQPDTRVGTARRHRLFGQGRQRIVVADEQTARIGHVPGCAGHRQARRRARLRHANVAGVVVVLRLHFQRLRRTAHRGDGAVARVQAVALAEGPLQLHAHAQQIAEEQAVGLDQDRLALRMRLAGHHEAAQQAG
jgi:hypothetical protein